MAILPSLWSLQFFTFMFALLAILQLQSNISRFQESQSHGAAQRIAIQIHQPHPKGHKQKQQVEKKHLISTRR